MPSKAEEATSRLLRPILAGLPTGSAIGDSDGFENVLWCLEFCLPEFLAEIHAEWKDETLDGICSYVATKSEEREVELFGRCYLMSDQTITALHLRLQLSNATDIISWLDLRLGERGEKGMVRVPHQSEASTHRLLHDLNRRAEKLEWVYKVTFGEKGDRAKD